MDGAADDPSKAAAAWLRGRQGGKLANAWLARAARLAPDDPRITLDLARARLSDSMADTAQAAADFARIAARFDTAPAWLGLAMARHKLGQMAASAEALDTLLTRHCLPEDPGFAQLAARIAADAGYDGFCGTTARGKHIASASQGRLLGATPDLAALHRVEGLAAAEGEAITGWATRPAAPETPPTLTLRDATGKRRAIKFGPVLPADDSAPLLPRHSFCLTPRQLHGLVAPYSLAGPDGAPLLGAPLDPATLTQPPVPAATRGPKRTKMPKSRPLAVIVPVYRGLAETIACLASLRAALPARSTLIVVDDATPEPALKAWLDAQAAAKRFRLLRHAQNQGFPAAANTGLAAAAGRDVLLLNADTLVPKGAIETLRAIAYEKPDTASVTPFSNAATILSYPNPGGNNPAPDLAGTAALHALAAKVNRHKSREIPTGIGFCMYLRHDALKATGGFRGEIFAQGYGEENDWCLRARHLGFTHRAALGAYVAHIGGVSFRASSRALTERNLGILNRLYPGYHALIMAFIAADPLAPARARLDAARLRLGAKQEAVLLISHSHGGGVARQVAAEMASWRAQGKRPLLLRTQFPDKPETTPYPWPALLGEGGKDDFPSLAFTLPGQKPALLRLLRALNVRRVVLHHALGHDPSVRGLAANLDVPQEIVVHDYASFCPRVNLLTPTAPPRYCGEPNLKGCLACTAHDRDEIHDPMPVPDLLARSAAEFAAAARVVTPSGDAAKRLARHFPGLHPQITPWEDDAAPVTLRPPGNGARRIMVIGGIGPSKGFDLLAECAEDAAARNLPLEFIVAGSSADDAALLATRRIFVTGGYREGEAQALIASFKPDLAFLPSIWPETWCFALGEAWKAGLYTLVFDLGAQAERMHATQRGATLPLGLPAARINDVLLTWQPGKNTSR